MTLPDGVREELERLLAAQDAGEWTAAEFEQLAALLRQSAAARQLYVAHQMLESQLEQEHLPPLTVPAGVQPVGEGEEGVRHLSCEAPSGPSRQKVPDTFVRALHSGCEAADMNVRPTAGRPLRAAAANWLRGWARDFAREPVALAVLLLVMLFGGALMWKLSTLRRGEIAQGEPRASENGEPRPLARGGGSTDGDGLAAPAGAESGRAAKTPPGADAPGSPNLETPGSPIAKLVRSVSAVWETTQAPADGASLKTGQKLVLKNGFAEIAFDTGAAVILEGPAELVVGGKGSGVRGQESGVGGQGSDGGGDNVCSLANGKLVARVPSEAIGFTVHTPALTIVDLGTEFGVTVQSEILNQKSEIPPTEVHVLRGEVKIIPAPVAVAQAPESKNLRAGEALISDPRGAAPRVTKAEPTRFVRELPAPQPAAPLAAWPKDSPLKPGDIVAVTCKGMKVFKVDPKSGEQTLLAQGIPYLVGPQDHGIAWHCLALVPDGTLLVGFDGLQGKEAGVVQIDPRSRKIRILASGGLMTSGLVNGLAVVADGTIFGVYDATEHVQPSHIVTIDPVNGAVSSIARLNRAQGMCMDTDGRSALVVVSKPSGVARLEAGTVKPWVSDIRADSCHAVAVAPNGRVYVTSIRDRVRGVRALLEVDRQSGRELRTVCKLPQAPRSDLPWHIAVEADGMLIAGPAVEDLKIYRVHPDTGKFQVLSSGGMLEDRTMVAVVPGGATGESK